MTNQLRWRLVQRVGRRLIGFRGALTCRRKNAKYCTYKQLIHLSFTGVRYIRKGGFSQSSDERKQKIDFPGDICVSRFDRDASGPAISLPPARGRIVGDHKALRMRRILETSPYKSIIKFTLEVELTCR